MCRPAILIAAVVDENLSGFGDVVVTVVRERPERCVARGPRVPVDCWYERAGLYPTGATPSWRAECWPHRGRVSDGPCLDAGSMKDALREGIDRVVSHPACLPDASATDGDVAFAPPMPDFTSLMVRHQRTSRSVHVAYQRDARPVPVWAPMTAVPGRSPELTSCT